MSNVSVADLSDRLLNVIIKNGHSRLSIADENGVFLELAPNFTSIYGGENQDYLGKSARELEKRGVLTPSVTAMVLDQRHEVALMLTTRLGRNILAQGFPVFDERGELIRIVTFSYDLTDLRVLREEYEDLQKSLVNQQDPSELREIEIEHIQFHSAAIKSIIELTQRVAKTQANVLFLGESGVGKTLFAKLLHRLSEREEGRLVELNCAALSADLIEAELFGYESGAFTGARRQGKPGLVEESDGGTLFLDEVGELSLSAQAKLLKAIQDRRVMRVGGTRERVVDFRLVTATNKDLKALVGENKFRLDLYYRINVIPIIIPPLRQRRDDVPLLIEYFWTSLEKRYRVKKALHATVCEQLLAYHWPGNVRELENVLERLFVSNPGSTINPGDMSLDLLPGASDDLATQGSCLSDGEWPESLPEAMARFERELLKNAKSRCKSTYDMAHRLGISQPSVARKLKKYGL